MRISDWSSDVCSSDLAAHRLQPEHPRRGAAAGGHDPDGLLPRSADPAGVQPCLRLPGVPQRAARRLRRLQSPLRPPGGLRLRPGGPGLLPAGRSEEHTSELQSLMRISYAVFCLKKTKIYIRNTRTILKNDAHS